MNNHTNLQVSHVCEHCKEKTLVCYTPNGADYNTCPLCDSSELNKYNYSLCDNIEDDDMLNYSYCEKCHIIYEIGCKHKVYGCTDDAYNAHLICEWKDKRTKQYYEGMPYFDNIDDWLQNVNYVQIIKWCCPNKKKFVII
jgi:hypothetical protein